MTDERDSLLLRGVLDLCVLSLMEHEPVYGYEIAARLEQRGLPVSPGSVYPLLARLERNGLVKAETRPSSSGPPRRWWRLSTAGRAGLSDGRTSWSRMSSAIDAVLIPEQQRRRKRA